MPQPLTQLFHCNKLKAGQISLGVSSGINHLE